jgi:small subunit ribosomal protein S13
MIRILGHTLLGKKKIYLALTSIYGIGLQSSLKILKKLSIRAEVLVSELDENETLKLITFFNDKNLLLEGRLKKFISLKIKKLITIQCYRGRRHLKKLPARGQRTRTNGRTARKKNIYSFSKK